MASAPTTPRFPPRLLANIRALGYTRTRQQDTDAILQDEVTRPVRDTVRGRRMRADEAWLCMERGVRPAIGCNLRFT
jgi:hypothetical protein